MAKGRSRVERADLKTARAAAPVRDSWPVRVLGQVSELADQPPLITICAATMVAGLIVGNRRLANTGGRMLAAELIATALKGAVKARVDRSRPHAVHDGERAYTMAHGHSDASADNSFPSGHTAGAVAVARAVAHGAPAYAPAAYATAAAVAAIQIPRLKHYPSDLAAGAVIGVVAEALVRAGEKALGQADKD